MPNSLNSTLNYHTEWAPFLSLACLILRLPLPSFIDFALIASTLSCFPSPSVPSSFTSCTPPWFHSYFQAPPLHTSTKHIHWFILSVTLPSIHLLHASSDQSYKYIHIVPVLFNHKHTFLCVYLPSCSPLIIIYNFSLHFIINLISLYSLPTAACFCILLILSYHTLLILSLFSRACFIPPNWLVFHELVMLKHHYVFLEIIYIHIQFPDTHFTHRVVWVSKIIDSYNRNTLKPTLP
jgi:hypothetical protein